MEIGTDVFYFRPSTHEDAGKIILAKVYKRPTTAPLADLWIYEPAGTHIVIDPCAQAVSLEQCIEVGNVWITRQQAIDFGINLEDGDQVIANLLT